MCTTCNVSVVTGLPIPSSIALYHTTGTVLLVQPSPIHKEKKHYIAAGNSTRDIAMCQAVGIYKKYIPTTTISTTGKSSLRMRSPVESTILRSDLACSKWKLKQLPRTLCDRATLLSVDKQPHNTLRWQPHQRGAEYTRGNRVCQLLYYQGAGNHPVSQ